MSLLQSSNNCRLWQVHDTVVSTNKSELVGYVGFVVSRIGFDPP